jgi:tripartite-type tricarboxylate transporter receptor subunit TctC
VAAAAFAAYVGSSPAKHKHNTEINAALADPKIQTRFADLGGTPLALTAAEYGKILADETEKWGKVIRSAGIKPE